MQVEATPLLNSRKKIANSKEVTCLGSRKPTFAIFYLLSAMGFVRFVPACAFSLSFLALSSSCSGVAPRTILFSTLSKLLVWSR